MCLDKKLLIELNISRSETLNSLKMPAIQLSDIHVCTFLRVFACEFYRSSHAKFSTEVCLFRSFISDPELTGPPSIYQNPGFSSYFRQPSRQWSE